MTPERLATLKYRAEQAESISLVDELLECIEEIERLQADNRNYERNWQREHE